MNDQDFKEIDRHLQKCMYMGHMAALEGKSKYENEFEPGSLSFDAWAAGFKLKYNADYQLPESNKSI
jgi:hypothetical protein